MIDDKYPTTSHFIPKQDYVEVDDKDPTSLLGLLKQILKPKPQIKFIHLSNPDFYPAYVSERENTFRAEKEVRELREEINNLKVKHWEEKDKLERRISELEAEADELKELVNCRLGEYL